MYISMIGSSIRNIVCVYCVSVLWCLLVVSVFIIGVKFNRVIVVVKLVMML